MANRTQEQLQQLFQSSRERKQQERERKKQLRIQTYKELCKQADDLLRKAEQEAKDKLMEQLQEKKKKKPQRASKQPPRTHYNIYNSNLIEREPSDRDLYTTKEALQQWEQDNYQVINWQKWNEVVEQTKEILKNI